MQKGRSHRRQVNFDDNRTTDIQQQKKYIRILWRQTQNNHLSSDFKRAKGSEHRGVFIYLFDFFMGDQTFYSRPLLNGLSHVIAQMDNRQPSFPMPMISLTFSFILYLCSLLVGLHFHILGPSTEFCCTLSWICGFSLMYVLPPVSYTHLTLPTTASV